MIVANDDRPRTMHAEAERTQPHMLPDAVRELLERHEQRRRVRREVWCQHSATERAWRAAYERLAVTDASHDTGIDLDAGGLEL